MKLEVKEKFDWERVAKTLLHSRALDDLEESKLLPEKKVLYQFSARGHDMAQILLGTQLDHPHDAASGYYRSRPLLLTLGLSLEDALAGPMGISGGFSDGRDIGVVCNLPNPNGCKVLPMAGGVGTQYTPTIGWSQSLRYRAEQLNESSYKRAIGVVLGGDGSTATNGFWSALQIATTQKLPTLFYIEDNGYGLSVPSTFQTPGGNIADNLASFRDLKIIQTDGVDPEAIAPAILEAIEYVRSWQGPVLLRLPVPRLSGHSGQDTQAYKSESFLKQEEAKDPLPRLRDFLVPAIFSESNWQELKSQADGDVLAALKSVEQRPLPDRDTLKRHVFFEGENQQQGGLLPEGIVSPEGTTHPQPEPTRINMLTAIRRTMQHELATNPRLLVFGEDVGPKGGVHGATLGLQDEFGDKRVFDTSLSEEGIIGRAVGMAYAGLMPVAEIQFRKYADPAQEQLNDCGTIRWRTNNRFAAPIVVRMPGGFGKCGDPWHSVCDEVSFAHAIGWQIAFPSNAEDAVGLLRSAMRSNNPTMFFEHRNLLDAVSARRPYPGNQYVVPFGQAKVLQSGVGITVITWGAMVERAQEAAQQLADNTVEVIDLRTIIPWDRDCVLQSVEKTGRALIVHEDALTAGFGAELAAQISEACFYSLKAPLKRLAVEDIPLPYNVGLLDEALPSVSEILNAMEELLELER